jgi:ABC-2 type transport system permease protein
MNVNFRNAMTIAQKEFADNLWSPIFLILLASFSLITIASCYQYGLMAISFVGLMDSLTPGVLRGLFFFSHTLSQFIPLFGIALSFDTLLREEKSGSMNVLLTHPVYRDNIITGKILGAMMSLLLVIAVSIALSIGTLIMFMGEEITLFEISRIALYFILTYLYSVIFLGAGLFISIIVKNTSDSLIYNIAVWLFFTIAYSDIIRAILYAFGIQIVDADGNLSVIFQQLLGIAPAYHYQQLVNGLFDVSQTIPYVLSNFWMDLTILVVVPIVLLVLSFIAFLRKDITL